jgi:integrase/recombinase XerC
MASEPLTRDEAKRLVTVAGMIGTDWTKVRDQAAFAVLYRCGIRSNEAVMLELHDLHEDAGQVSIRIRFPKGWNRKTRPTPPREVGVDAGTRALLEVWLELRGGTSGPLFCTPAFERLDTSHWRRKIKKAANGAKISKRVHLHGLRHTYARMLHDEGVSVRLIQGALGHRSLDTTAIYLGSLGSPEVVAATVGREW